MTVTTVILPTALLLSLAGSALGQTATPDSAQPQSAGAPTTPARYIKVDAPYAQKLLLDAKAAHPELKKIGFHAVPPGGTESAIIANPITSKIGKLSSANDLTVIASGKPKVYPHAEEGGFFDLGLPMVDSQQRPIGMMVMEIPYAKATTPAEALRMGLAIRDEIAAKIPSKEFLFAPVPQ